MTFINIHYTRLPERRTIFRQQLVHSDENCIVTFNPETQLDAPVYAGDRIILDPGAPAVWFTFPGRWHDIGRFHRADGTFTGYYANILTPVRFESRNDLLTTDLCLDVWLDADGRALLLDEEEFEHAVAQGWIDADTANRARAEAEGILCDIADGKWPPPVVARWTLEAARADREPGSPTGVPSRASHGPAPD